MIIQNIEVWAEEFKKTHTWTELVNEVLKMYTDDISAINMLMLRVPKVHATESSVDNFDALVRERLWNESVEEIKSLTGQELNLITTENLDIKIFCGKIIEILCLGNRGPSIRDMYLLPDKYPVHEQLILCCLAGIALDAQLSTGLLATVLYTITYRLIYHVHYRCTLSIESYMSEETSGEKDISWYTYAGIRFYSGTLKPID